MEKKNAGRKRENDAADMMDLIAFDLLKRTAELEGFIEYVLSHEPWKSKMGDDLVGLIEKNWYIVRRVLNAHIEQFIYVAPGSMAGKMELDGALAGCGCHQCVPDGPSMERSEE